MKYYFYPGNDDVFHDALDDINNTDYINQGVFVIKDLYSPFDHEIVQLRNRLSYHYMKSDPIVKFVDSINWYLFSAIKKDFDTCDETCYIFSNLTVRLIPYYILKRLSLDQNKHLILYFLDSSNNPLCFEALELTKSIKFDAIFTFDKNDASRFGFRHIYYIYSKFRQNQKIKASDKTAHHKLGFWGSDKGRLPLLEGLSEMLSRYNISHHFSIVGVDEGITNNDTNIEINHSIPYREIIDELQNVDIILDVVVPGQTGLSYRAIEAVCYNKKLLTNNPTILQFPYYNQRYMRYFDSVDSVDISFLLDDDKVQFEYNNEYSPVKFLNTIKSIVE